MYTLQGIYIYQQVNKVEYMYNIQGIYLPLGLQGLVHEHCTGYIPPPDLQGGVQVHSTLYRVYTYHQVYKGELHSTGYIPTTRFTRGSSTCTLYTVHGIYLPPGLQGGVHVHCTGYKSTNRYT